MSLEELPEIGLGTHSEGDREQWGERVELALEVGYRHVDTAQDYGNEAYLGEGIASSEVPREELFLATKVASEALSYEDVLDSVEESLEKLRTEYVDLLYVHWPIDAYDPAETLSAFDELRDRGAIRHVGVSNFEPDQLDRARDALDAPIAANQVECHPFLPQEELRTYAREHDHRLVAYCPLAQGAVFESADSEASVIGEIAENHEASPAQVALAWLIGKENVAAIPKASSEAHMRDNLAARELSLDPEDVERIDAIEREHRVIDPEFGPWNR